MTRDDLRRLVKEQAGCDLVPGYNYVIFSITARPKWWQNPDRVQMMLTEAKDRIEARMQKHMEGFKLLPFVCLKRKLSVLVPTPFETPINTLTNVLHEVFCGRLMLPKWG